MAMLESRVAALEALVETLHRRLTTQQHEITRLTSQVAYLQRTRAPPPSPATSSTSSPLPPAAGQPGSAYAALNADQVGQSPHPPPRGRQRRSRGNSAGSSVGSPGDAVGGRVVAGGGGGSAGVGGGGSAAVGGPVSASAGVDAYHPMSVEDMEASVRMQGRAQASPGVGGPGLRHVAPGAVHSAYAALQQADFNREPPKRSSSGDAVAARRGQGGDPSQTHNYEFVSEDEDEEELPDSNPFGVRAHTAPINHAPGGKEANFALELDVENSGFYHGSIGRSVALQRLQAAVLKRPSRAHYLFRECGDRMEWVGGCPNPNLFVLSVLDPSQDAGSCRNIKIYRFPGEGLCQTKNRASTVHTTLRELIRITVGEGAIGTRP